MAGESSPIPVSVIVMTKNEEKNIASCLERVSRFSEVFVVDSASMDRTCEIAKSCGATVVPFVWNGQYPKKKQWCLDNLPFRHDWVLYVDADEEVTPAVAEEIASVVSSGAESAGYFIAFDYFFSGRMLRHGHRLIKLILLNRSLAHFPEYDDLAVEDPVEIELHFQPRLEGRAGSLRTRMVHHDHDTLTHWIERHNAYSTWEAYLRVRGELPRRDDTQPGVRGALKRWFNLLPAKAFVAFCWSYIFRFGFLDGKAGFRFALARAFYYWQIGEKMREYGRVRAS
jgi:glycosyltransferase involved in cell wall biosynthesis